MSVNMTTPTIMDPDEIIANANFRISPQVFTASIFTFLALSIVIASYRIYLRFITSGRLGADDYWMIAAVLSFAASIGVTQYTRELLYLQMAVALIGGQISPGDDYAARMIDLGKLDTAQYILEWTAIYCVKFSYLFFFRPLVKRIRIMEIWWRIVVVLMAAISLPTIFLGFWVCPHYDSSFVAYCIQTGDVYVHEQILLTISTANDIATDIMIISIPLFLLTRVQVELKRKLALGAVLCLSVVMIIIASIRYALCPIHGYQRNTTESTSVPDSIWLFFWQAVECFVSISMVSLTAFRSLYGQAKRSKSQHPHAYNYLSVGHTDSWRRNGHNTAKSITKSINIEVVSEAREEEMHIPEKPDAARIAK